MIDEFSKKNSLASVGFPRYRFIYLSKESQIELLEFLAYPNSLETWGEGQTGDQTGHNHFQNLKGWITRAFYSSEAGMKALGWNGEISHGTLTACVSKQG